MLNDYPLMIDNKLSEIFVDNGEEYSVLIDAMKYSISAGGKRIRPSLLLEFSKICGLEPQKAIMFAVALEMIHTYSLIHDDLPCMDDDDMRRSKPSCHIVYGEANALLAGDALLTEAFNTALKTQDLPSDRVLKASLVLSSCAGINGMIGGQVIDLKYEGKDMPLESVLQMYLLKTGALLVAAAKIGCILAGASDEKVKSAGEFAKNIGLAFQIRDDILDIIGNESELGKPIGSDANAKKSTFVSYVGIEKAQQKVIELTDNAIKSLKIFGDAAEDIKAFALKLCNRNR